MAQAHPLGVDADMRLMWWTVGDELARYHPATDLTGASDRAKGMRWLPAALWMLLVGIVASLFALLAWFVLHDRLDPAVKEAVVLTVERPGGYVLDDLDAQTALAGDLRLDEASVARLLRTGRRPDHRCGVGRTCSRGSPMTGRLLIEVASSPWRTRPCSPATTSTETTSGASSATC